MKVRFIFSLSLIVFYTIGSGNNNRVNFNDNQSSEEKENTVLTKIWETEQILKTPESVCYDEENKILYVSNVNGEPLEKDNNGFISKVSLEGKIVNLKWIEGLNAPKGMGIFNSKLYVADIDVIVEIDIKKNIIVKKHKAENAKILNDISITDEGIVFVSDTYGNRIYKLENNKVSVWLEYGMLNNPNGLLIYKEFLLVGCKPIISVNLNNKTTKVFVKCTRSVVDGLVKDNNDNLYFSHWAGRIFKINNQKQVIEILSTVQNNVQSADIEIIEDKNILLVPTFHDNRVVAYQINEQ